MTSFQVPALLAETARHQPEVASWIEDLPGIVAGLAERWSLRLNEPFQPGGFCSWTAPATRASGENLVLKVGFPFATGEDRDEAAALRIWDGDGAVRLHAAQSTDMAHALLMERCVPGTWLRYAMPEAERDVVIARMPGRLWARAAAGRLGREQGDRPGREQPQDTRARTELTERTWPFRPLTQMCDEWADEFERKYAAAGPAQRLDPGLARAGMALFRELPRTAERAVLLCTDLHHENILAAEREPWLVVDPKPYAGDPAYDVLQHMLNCADRLVADPGGLCDRMASLAALDAGRVRQWLFARVVQESVHWSSRAPLMRQIAAGLAP